MLVVYAYLGAPNFRIAAAYRPPGGTFEPAGPRQLARRPNPTAGFDAAGNVTIAWHASVQATNGVWQYGFDHTMRMGDGHGATSR